MSGVRDSPSFFCQIIPVSTNVSHSVANRRTQTARLKTNAAPASFLCDLCVFWRQFLFVSLGVHPWFQTNILAALRLCVGISRPFHFLHNLHVHFEVMFFIIENQALTTGPGAIVQKIVQKLPAIQEQVFARFLRGFGHVFSAQLSIKHLQHHLQKPRKNILPPAASSLPDQSVAEFMNASVAAIFKPLCLRAARV